MVSNGQVLFALLAGALLSLPLSVAILWLYRRAVLASMRRTSARLVASPAAARVTDTAPTSVELDLLDQGTDLAAQGAARPIFLQAERRPWINALVYGVAGLAATVVDTVLYLSESEATFAPLRVLIVLWTVGWPIVLVTTFLVARGRRDQLRIVGVYVVGIVLLSATQTDQWWLVPYLWVIASLPPTLYQLIFLHRKLRAVGPLVIVFTLVGVVGTEVAMALLGSPLGLSLASVVLSVLSATQLIAVVVILGFALFAVLGWRALGWIARRYDAKQITDQSLTIDALWLTFIADHALSFSADNLGWSVFGLAGFGLYKLIVWRGFIMANRHAGTIANHRLLLLRVFGSQGRSEKLMDRIGARWRYTGSIQLIAGTDLAADALEPHELLDFVRGRLQNRYVSDAQAVDRQMQAVDLQPDYDGRFRMSEFFCYDDTWRLTLSRLASSSDAVLMDLRTFSRANQGCIFELRELVNRVPLERVVLLVDGTTDVGFLQDVLREAGQVLALDSPNARSGALKITACRLTGEEAASSRLVLSRLAVAAATGGVRLPGPVGVAAAPELGTI